MAKQWIEELGSVEKAAARIAPAIRAALHADFVCFSAMPDLDAASFASACRNGGLTGEFLEGADLEAIYAQLPKLAQDVQTIGVGGLGCFAPKQATPAASRDQRLCGKVAIVTGSAQGFGDGIARELAARGACVVIADLNDALAQKNADELNATYGASVAIAVKADVTNEASVEALIEQTVLAFGGLDLFVSNAGIVRAGSLEEMSLADFELVTKINYTAFFICTKYASRVMKLQHRFDPERYADIVQINSKSGLDGSNKNFAYAGSKFGGIGLVQSFAKELVEHNVKVNAICPGNYYEGPLWSDPDKGLFVQYLNAGKIPGAKTVADVRESYVSKVPMRKGCSPLDVARAICYCVEQENETGQAIPVTGGQIMLA